MAAARTHARISPQLSHSHGQNKNRIDQTMQQLSYLLEEVGREDVHQRSVAVVHGGHGGVLRRGDVMDLVVEVGPGVGSRVGRHFRRPSYGRAA